MNQAPSSPSSQEDSLRKSLAGVKRIVAITGAGISQESNIPTFRDAGGLWTKYDPEKFATAAAIKRDLNRVWAWHDGIRMEIAKAKPNSAHILLADLEARYEVIVCTQNIDGLHQAAGSKNVIEIHGNISRARCTYCNISWYLPEEPLFKPEHYVGFDPPDDYLPRCLQCRRISRPDVLLFNELYGKELDQVLHEIKSGVDLILIIGSSGGVPTPYYLAREAYENHRCPVFDINPGLTLNDSSELFPTRLRLRKTASEGMSMVWNLLTASKAPSL